MSTRALKARFYILIYTARIGRYIPICQVTDTLTARYWVVPPKSTVGGQLREKKGRRRRRRRRKEERRGEERIPRVVLARALSPPAVRPRAVATLAR
ncbi:hypothetical protein B296_00035252, partial [Ensete ventricosum]